MLSHSFLLLASPRLTQVDNGVKHNNLRSLYTPYNQYPPLHVALLPTKTGVQTGTNSETRTSGNFGEASSIIDHQSNHLQFSYDQNSRRNKRSGTGITEVWKGHSAGGMRAPSSIVTKQRLDRTQQRLIYQHINRNFYNYPPIIRKSSQKEAGGPFHQGFSQVWPPENPQKPYNKAKVPGVYSFKAAGDKKVWKYSVSSLLLPPNGGYWTTLLPTPRGHYSGYKETNELAAVGVQSTSSRIQSSKFLGFASQTAPRAPSISKSLDTSVIKSNPSPEKLTSSITDFSQGMNSVSSSETQRYKKAQSYLFKNSQTSFHGRETMKKVTSDGAGLFSITPHEQQTSAAQGYSRLSSDLRRFQQSHQKDPTKEVRRPSNNVRQLYHNSTVAHYGAQTHSLTKYPPVTTISSTPTQLSSYPASGKTLESFAPVHHADSQYSNAPSSETAVVGKPLIKATRGSMHDYKPAQSTNSLYGFRGFENPTRRAVKDPPILSSSDGNSFDKGKIHKFKIGNGFSSLSPKYSFGLWGTSTTTTTQAKPEMTPTYSSSPSPRIFYITQTTTVSTPGSFPSGFKEVRSESDTHMDINQNHRQFRISKKIYGLKGFGSQPLEGAEALVREPDKSATLQQDFEGFELRSSQIWQPKSSRIHRWYNQTGEAKQGTGKTSTQSQNKQQSEDFKSLLKAAGSVESVNPSRFSPDKYKKNRKTYAFLGFQLVQNRNGNANSTIHWKYTEQSPTTGSPTHKVSSAYLTPAGGLTVESSLKSEPRTVNKSKPVAMKARLLNISTSSIVRGRRVKGKRREKLNKSVSLSNNTVNVAIVRLPKCPISVTYADILGSASFSSVRVTTQAPTTTTDKDYFLNTTVTTRQKEGEQESSENTSRSPEANAENDVEDFSSVEEKEQSVKSGEADRGMETFDPYLEGEGSGNSHLNHVLSPDITKSQALNEDLSEQDYLQKSTGINWFSFKSMKLSHSDKW